MKNSARLCLPPASSRPPLAVARERRGLKSSWLRWKTCGDAVSGEVDIEDPGDHGWLSHYSGQWWWLIVVFFGYKPTTMGIWWYMSGWWFGTFLPFHILGISSSQLAFIFFRGVGWNHQPVVYLDNKSNDWGTQICAVKNRGKYDDIRGHQW